MNDRGTKLVRALSVVVVAGLLACGGGIPTEAWCPPGECVAEKSPRVASVRTKLAAARIARPAFQDFGTSGIVQLGQVLFFDPELSGNRDTACASCHLPGEHGADLLAVGVGRGAIGHGRGRQLGTPLPRNTPAPFNRVFATRLFWDGRVEQSTDGAIHAPVELPRGVGDVLEAQALLPLLDRVEMRGLAGDRDFRGRANELAIFDDSQTAEIWEAIARRLRQFPDYVSQFDSVFGTSRTYGGSITALNIARAIAAFEKRIWSGADTPFDNFLVCDTEPCNALAPPVATLRFAAGPSPDPGLPIYEAIESFDVERVRRATGAGKPRGYSERFVRGMEVFFELGCATCHSGPLLSDQEAHNIGVPPRPTDPLDIGRIRVTGRAEDEFAFITPPLRNVGLTAPYMHNGMLPDLRAVIVHHLDPARSFARFTPDLPAASRDQILATLDPAIRAPRASPTEGDLFALELFLALGLLSDGERAVFPRSGEPGSVPSGLEVPRNNASRDAGFRFPFADGGVVSRSDSGERSRDARVFEPVEFDAGTPEERFFDAGVGRPD